MPRHCTRCNYTGEGVVAGTIAGTFAYGCTEATVMKCPCGITMWLPIYTQGYLTYDQMRQIKAGGDGSDGGEDDKDGK